MPTKFEKAISQLKQAEEDVLKGYGGNKAASVRARKTLMTVRDLIQDTRLELLEVKKGELAPTRVAAQLTSDEA